MGIALALLDAGLGLAEGSELALDLRGRPVPVRLVRPPFVDASPRR
jgi:aminomethyltransferase